MILVCLHRTRQIEISSESFEGVSVSSDAGGGKDESSVDIKNSI